MPTAAENLIIARGNACARLAELDTVAVDVRARMTYTIGAQTYDWNAYRRALLDEIDRLSAMIVAVSDPWTNTSEVVR